MKTKKKKAFFKNCFKGIQLMYHAKPRTLILYVIFTIVHGISWALQIIYMQQFFDAATKFAIHQINLRTVLLSLVAMGLSYALCQIMNGVNNCHGNIVDLAISKYTNIYIFKRVNKLSLIDFEDTNRLNFINKAMTGRQNFAWVCIALLDTIFFYSIYFITLGWYLFTLKPILGISILIVFLPCLISRLTQIASFKSLEDKSASIRRECDYYEKCLVDKELFKETRILGATGYFKKLYITTLHKLNHMIFLTQLKKNVINFVLGIVTIIGYGIIIYMIFVFVMRKEISIGTFAAVLTSINRMYEFMDELISTRIGWATENVATVKNFLDFVNEEQLSEKLLSRPEKNSISLRNVSFTYPMTSKKALDNINLTINSNETLAIVGENGSGKTTLCRLIMGLYQPCEGEITINNIATSDIDFCNISAVFQKYCRYKMTLKDNITISDTEMRYEDDQLKDICNKTGVQLNGTFSDGLNTMLSREFNGIDVSGGEWQRVAIARGMFRPSDLIVLDEPTAAIDPIEETRLYNDFKEMCEDKTSIIVTHRLGSTKIADRIIVLKDGQIVQDGNHEQLISVDGEYRNMYNLQKKWYIVT